MVEHSEVLDQILEQFLTVENSGSLGILNSLSLEI